MIAKTKSPWLSKTIWANALTILTSVLLLVAGNDFVQSYPKAVSFLLLLVGIINVVLRFITGEPIKFEPPQIRGRSYLLVFVVACLTSSSAFGQPPLQPYRDYVQPAQHWRRSEVWECHRSLFGGCYWTRRVIWQPLYQPQQ